jgi:hypothetical protein
MDSARGIDDRFDTPEGDAAVSDVALDVGGDERRMHVRAYNYWVSLLRGRPYPSVEDLDPESIADFGPQSVLLDFSEGIEDPRIQFLGRELREECGIEAGIRRIADVPSRSLLSRLTDHYLQIIANRAPIGFEAEFTGTRGHATLYRGILMPFSSNGDAIDFIYGVINWKELVDAATQAQLNAEIAAARRALPITPSAPVWADGPSAGLAASDDDADVGTEADADSGITVDDALLMPDSDLADQLLQARESAVRAQLTETRSRATLYRALARAYCFAHATKADPDGYAELLADAGLSVQARAPMTPIVKLVFGADYDKTRVTEFAAVLAHAARHDVPADGLFAWLEGKRGGIKAVVAEERVVRRPGERTDMWEALAAELRARPPLAHAAIGDVDDEFVVLLARRASGGVEIVAVDADRDLTSRAARRAAA